MRVFILIGCVLPAMFIANTGKAEKPSILFGESMILSTRGIGRRWPRQGASLYLLLDRTAVSKDGLPEPTLPTWKRARLLIGQHTRRNGIQKLHVEFYSSESAAGPDAITFYAEAKRQFADLDVFVVATTSFSVTDKSFGSYVESVRDNDGQPNLFPDSPLASDSPLARAVRHFNEAAADRPIGSREPELTVDEVIAAIRAWNRERNPIDDESLMIYERIADTGVLPDEAKFEFTERWHVGKGRFVVWWIDLSIKIAPNRGYAFRIRDRKLKFM